MMKTHDLVYWGKGVAKALLIWLLASSGAWATLTQIFSADVGSSSIFATGGTATKGTTSDVTYTYANSNPLLAGGGYYLKIVAPSSGSAVITGMTLTPSSATNSWYGMSGGVTSGGTNFVSLNGAFDVYFRANSGVSTDQSWLRMIDVGGTTSGNGGLRMIVRGDTNSKFRVELGSDTSLNILSTDGSTWGTSVYSTFNYAVEVGMSYHFAYTMSTDASGLVSVNLYIADNAADIDTSSDTPMGSYSFYIKSDGLNTASTNNMFLGGSSKWTMNERTSTTWAGADVDWDMIRLYSGDPTGAVFSAIPEPSTWMLVAMALTVIIFSYRHANMFIRTGGEIAMKKS